MALAVLGRNDFNFYELTLIIGSQIAFQFDFFKANNEVRISYHQNF